MSRPQLRPFISYYGGKYRAAPRYPAPRYDTIIEPFAGFAGYALRYYWKRVLLIERFEPLAAMWQWLIRAPVAEIMALPLLGDDDDLRDMDLRPEARTLIGYWLNAGNVQPCNVPGAWMRSRERPSVFWGAEVRARIAGQLDLIRHWQVRCDDYEAAPDIEATWYIDPPYQVAGGRYPESLAGGDYDDLARWCRTRRGQVIVCEAVGARWLPFRPFGEIKGTPGYYRMGGSIEAIWTNDADT